MKIDINLDSQKICTGIFLHTLDNVNTRMTLIYVMGPNTAASKHCNIVALEEQSSNAVA